MRTHLLEYYDVPLGLVRYVVYRYVAVHAEGAGYCVANGEYGVVPGVVAGGVEFYSKGFYYGGRDGIGVEPVPHVNSLVVGSWEDGIAAVSEQIKGVNGEPQQGILLLH